MLRMGGPCRLHWEVPSVSGAIRMSMSPSGPEGEVNESPLTALLQRAWQGHAPSTLVGQVNGGTPARVSRASETEREVKIQFIQNHQIAWKRRAVRLSAARGAERANAGTGS